jgi:hypothetical protein
MGMGAAVGLAEVEVYKQGHFRSGEFVLSLELYKEEGSDVLYLFLTDKEMKSLRNRLTQALRETKKEVEKAKTRWLIPRAKAKPRGPNYHY